MQIPKGTHIYISKEASFLEGGYLKLNEIKGSGEVKYYTGITKFFYQLFGKTVDIEDQRGNVYSLSKSQLRKFIEKNSNKKIDFNSPTFVNDFFSLLDVVKTVDLKNRVSKALQSPPVDVNEIAILLKKCDPQMLKNPDRYGNTLLHLCINQLKPTDLISLLNKFEFPEECFNVTGLNRETPLCSMLLKYRNTELNVDLLKILLKKGDRSLHFTTNWDNLSTLDIAIKYLSDKQLEAFFNVFPFDKLYSFNALHHLSKRESSPNLHRLLFKFPPKYLSRFASEQPKAFFKLIKNIGPKVKVSSDSFVQKILNSFDLKDLLLKNKAGDNLLHLAIKYSAAHHLSLFISNMPIESFLEQNNKGEIPLQLALNRNLDLQKINEIFERNPAALNVVVGKTSETFLEKMLDSNDKNSKIAVTLFKSAGLKPSEHQAFSLLNYSIINLDLEAWALAKTKLKWLDKYDVISTEFSFKEGSINFHLEPIKLTPFDEKNLLNKAQMMWTKVKASGDIEQLKFFVNFFKDVNNVTSFSDGSTLLQNMIYSHFKVQWNKALQTKDNAVLERMKKWMPGKKNSVANDTKLIPFDMDLIKGMLVAGADPYRKVWNIQGFTKSSFDWTPLEALLELYPSEEVIPLIRHITDSFDEFKNYT